VKILCVWGRHNYGDPARGESYECVNFLPALSALGHHVTFFETWDRRSYADFGELNCQLLRRVEEVRPDMVFTVLLGYEVWLETLDLIRGALGCPVLNWGTDDSWKYAQFSRFIAPHVDRYATTYESALERFRTDGIRNAVLTQWAASSAALREPAPAAACEYPVSFVGTAYGRRARWIDELAQRGVKVECFGHGWPNGPVAAERIPEIIRSSVISVNFSEAGPGSAAARQIKARVFEVPGSGGFLLTETAPGLERFYLPDIEIGTFETLDELATKVRHYLTDKEARNRVAQAGHARTRQQHTYEKRFSQLLAGIELTTARQISTEQACRKIDALAARHRARAWERMLASALTAPASVVWGRRRGPRAARRFLFELSWRVAGERTYSSRGCPGRLFYAES